MFKLALLNIYVGVCTFFERVAAPRVSTCCHFRPDEDEMSDA